MRLNKKMVNGVTLDYLKKLNKAMSLDDCIKYYFDELIPFSLCCMKTYFQDSNACSQMDRLLYQLD